MESYGNLLRTAREEKNLDLDKISREISIERRYLEGLESEDNGVFPGEAYLTGFLRNYANYLDLDAEFLLKLYRNKQIQESPLPQGLYGKRRPRFLIPGIIIPSVLLVGFVIVLSILLLEKKKTDVDSDVVISNKVRNKQYELTEKKFTQRVYKGDQLLVPSADGEGHIVLTVRDTLSSFGLDTPSGIYYVELSEESEIDLSGNGVSDMILYVSDISSTDESRGAEISVLLRQGGFVQASTSVDEIPLASDLKSAHQPKVIHEDNRAYPFTINASFRGSCLFRSKVDRSDSVEGYFTRGEVFTATPQNGIRLWISNNNTVKFTIIADSKSYDIDIGSAGQIFVEDIKWIKDSDGRYKLVVIELD
ncbi:MAG: helix-turn-helix domain-containing protein [Treponema sp.]|nr:helix-turn-helix domain-containing protein [Treponema sp.]